MQFEHKQSEIENTKTETNGILHIPDMTLYGSAEFLYCCIMSYLCIFNIKKRRCGMIFIWAGHICHIV